MIRIITVFISFTLLGLTAFAQSNIDSQIASLAKNAGIRALEILPPKNEELFEVGRVLFQDKSLSGNRNISCLTCHDPKLGTSDGLMLSVGQGRLAQSQGSGVVLRRHSPSIFDLGQKEARQMFWDSRVSQHWKDWSFETPEPRLNGLNPSAKHIFSAFRRAVDVQAIFPLVDRDEMLGPVNANDLAIYRDHLKIWEAIVSRLQREQPALMLQLTNALQLTSPADINIGHVATAIGEFVAYAFQANQTPLDQYLRGDLNALNAEEKEGFLVFLSSGRCSFCHNGPLLSNGVTLNIGVPPIKTNTQKTDLGRYELTQNIWDYAMFRTPRLRNVSLSAPYMHNGVYRSLEEVLDHYSSIYSGLYDFEPHPDSFKPYSTKISRVFKTSELDKISDMVSPLIETSVRLKPAERQSLLIFLKQALTDSSYLKQFP